MKRSLSFKHYNLRVKYCNKRKVLFFLCVFLACVFSSVNAQSLQTLSLYPQLGPLNSSNYNGLTFEINSSNYIQLHRFEVPLRDLGAQAVEIYYRKGGVEHAAGMPPIVDGTHGWVSLGILNVNVDKAGIPGVSEVVDIFLPPGDYGFYVTAQSSQMYYRIDSDTVQIGGVSLRTTGWKGQAPNLEPINTGDAFIGGVQFRALSHLPGDLAVLNVDTPKIYCAGSHILFATIANFGSTPITSTSLNWSVNGVTQPAVVFSGLLDTATGQGSLIQDVVLGNYSLNSGQQYNLQVWSSLPNGNVDPYTTNDTVINTLYAALDGGTYTINPTGSGPNNFTSFSAVSQVLNNGGVCGSVHFDVAPGVYNDHLFLNHVKGTSLVNTITFDGGDSALVNLTYSSSADTATVLIQGTEHVIIKRITISNNSTSDTWGLMLRENANYITIDSCKFMLPIASTTDMIAVIASSNMAGEGNGENANYTTISNCTFIGGECGINLEGPGERPYAVGHRILKNVFRFQDDHALDLDQISGIEIAFNDVDSMTNGGADAFIFDEIDDFVITGNRIISPDIAFDLNDANDGFVPATPSVISNNTIISETDNAFDIDDFEYVNLYYNSVIGFPAIEINDPVEIDIRNNIFSSTSVAFGTDAVIAATNIVDYNLYYGGLEIAGTSLSALTDWQSVSSSHNIHSLQGLPMFISSRDLHINGPLANGNADPTVGIMVDIDQEPRSASNPDIGADEINIFVDTCLQAGGFRPGARTAFSVTFDMDRSGVSYSLEWGPCGFVRGTGTVVMGVSPLTISGLSPNNCYEFYARRVCSSSNNYNDSIGPFRVRTECTSPLSGGMYTVDPGQPLSSSNYHSMIDVAKSLENCGISGPVTFNVAPGNYIGSLYFPEITGSSASNTITFNGADSSNTRVYYDGVSTPTLEATVKVEGCDWLTFDNLKIENGSTSSTSQVILVGNSSDNLIVSNCAIIHATGAAGDCILLSDNVPSNGSLSSNFGDNITLEHNTIRNGIGLTTNGSARNSINGVFLDSNLRISENVFVGLMRGMQLRNLASFRIENNEISDIAEVGIALTRVRDFKILENVVFGGTTSLGIFTSYSNLQVPNRIVNNVLHTNSAAWGGLELWDCNGIGVYHNIIAKLLIDGSQKLDVKNNILQADGGVAIELSSTVTYLELDYNNYYASGTGLLFQDNQGGNYSSLDSWQAAYPTYDQHSFSSDPQFAGPLDFHVSSPLLNNTGDSLGIVTDLDGSTRSLHYPDIGAYEFSLPCLSVTLNGSAVNIAPTSAEISWTRQFNQGTSTGTTNNIEYGPSGFSLGSGMELKAVSSPQLLTGLSQGTTYEFYVQDSCGTEGTSSWAGPYSFTTTVVPCTPSTALGADQNSPVGARLFWIAGGAVQWNVEYGPTGFTPGAGTLLYNNQTNSVALNTLAGSTCYDFYVQDSCGLNYVSAWTGPFNFCTQACTAPTNLSADQITPTGARLLWTTGGAANWNVEYGPTGFTPGSGTYVYNTSSNTFNINSLSGGTCYDFYVQDSCGTNSTSSWSGPYNFCTLSCAAPTNLGADQIRTTGARVYWAAGGASDWNVEYGPAGFTLGTGNYLYGAQNDTVTVNALLAGTCYDLYVQDSCGAGNTSSWSGPYNFCTLSCTAPSNLGADQITSGGARLYWTPGNAHRWNVEYGVTGFTLGSGTYLHNNSNDTLLLNTLTASTCYDLYVRDSCGIGITSGWTGPYNFCTIGCALNAGNDSTINACLTDPTLDLTLYLGIHDAGGTWVDMDGANFLSGSMVIFGPNSNAGSFRLAYYVTEPGCPNDTALITLQVDAAPKAGADVSRMVCDTAVLDLDTVLSGQDAGGVWLDVNNSGALSGSVVDFNGIAANTTYAYQYVLESAGCGNDTATVSIYVDSCGVGIQEYGLQGFAVYPNPSSGTLHLTFVARGAQAQLYLTDLSGQLVYSKTLSNLNGTYKGSIDISDLATGTYLLTVESEGAQEVVRILRTATE